MSETYNVLFLSIGNSARSILAEGLLNRIGKGRFQAYSAGSKPANAVHPHAARLLELSGLEPSGYRPKNWQEFTGPGAPELDFVFTVCDDAAGEQFPEWPGQPVTAHWGVPDPAKGAHSDAEMAAAFDETARAMRHRLEAFCALPLASIDRMSLQHHLREIHKRPSQPA